MRVSKKSLILTLCLTISLGLAAPTFAAARERDGGSERNPVTRILQIVKRRFGLRANDIPTVPMPAPTGSPIP